MFGRRRVLSSTNFGRGAVFGGVLDSVDVTRGREKGQGKIARRFVDAVRRNGPRRSPPELLAVARVTIEIDESCYGAPTRRASSTSLRARARTS